MNDELRDIIVKVLAEHQDSRVSLEEDAMPSYLVRCYGNGEVAGCSWEKFAYTFDAAVDEWRGHVASELVSALDPKICGGCHGHFDNCEPKWAEQRKCCPDCTHGQVPRRTLANVADTADGVR